MTHAAIASTGRMVPPVRMTNVEVEQKLGQTVDEWLRKNVGIEARHFMSPEMTTSDMAAQAGRQALERAKVEAKDVDLIIVATDTPDQPSPATAAVVQYKLGATRAAVFDLNTACAGWVTALDVGTRFVQTGGGFSKVLVIGAYGMSRFIDWKDKTTATLFADGAGAVLLQASEQPGWLGSAFYADGSYHDALGIYRGGVTAPVKPGDEPAYVKFVRKFPATYNTEHWPALLKKAAGQANVSLRDVDLFLFTQLNLRTIEAVMQILEQPLSKAHWIMDKWGYTGSACIPMALDDALEQGKLKRGQLVAFCGSGGGIAMASSIFRF